MTQMAFDFALPSVVQKTDQSGDVFSSTKENLASYIKVCGLVAYKDFYMKIKTGLVAIPSGMTQAQYLMLAREVYESRAAKVNRPKPEDRKAARAKFFAIKNARRKAGYNHA